MWSIGSSPKDYVENALFLQFCWHLSEMLPTTPLSFWSIFTIPAWVLCLLATGKDQVGRGPDVASHWDAEHADLPVPATSSATLVTVATTSISRDIAILTRQVSAALAKPRPSQGLPLSGTSPGYTSRWTDSRAFTLTVVRARRMGRVGEPRGNQDYFFHQLNFLALSLGV